jgi:hypothetical protein
MTPHRTEPPSYSCRHCGSRVRLVESRLGGRLLLDLHPHADGRVVLLVEDGRWVGELRRGYRAIALREQGLELYRVHAC